VKALPLLSCLLVAACANLETKPWFKVDGNPASAEQLDLDKTTCRQEMQRSVQATTQAAALDYNIIRSDVFETCMSRLGYSDKNNGRFTAPAAVQGGPAPPVAQASRPRQLFRAAQRRQPIRPAQHRQPFRAAPCRRRSRATSRRRAISNPGRLWTSACGCRSARDRGVDWRARTRSCSTCGIARQFGMAIT
jgi:hypothetical protein